MPRETPATLRSTDTAPLLRSKPVERRATAAAAVMGAGAVAWVWLGPATQQMDGMVRAVLSVPAFALGFGVVMVAAAAASDLGGQR